MVYKSKTVRGAAAWLLIVLPWVLGWLFILALAIALVERLAS